MARLNQVAQVVEGTGPNQINRRDLMREVAINANVFNRSAGEVSGDIRKILDGIQLPPGYRYQFGGSTKNMAESFGYAISALVLAIVFIYMILASQFKSFLQPMALMTALPLTLIGVVLALLMFGSSLSMFSIIGVIMLMGLVTKTPFCWSTLPSARVSPKSSPMALSSRVLAATTLCYWLPKCVCAPF